MTRLHLMVGEYVKRNGVTLGHVADGLSITRVSLNNKLSGRTEFKLGEAARLAEILGTDIDEVWRMNCENC